MGIRMAVTQGKMMPGGLQAIEYIIEEMALATIGLTILVPEK